MAQGYLNLVFHAHLPFVRHPDRDDYLEQRWLFEAITECYIPLLQTLHRLHDEGVDYRVTISLSPPLLAMLSDPLIQTRYQAYLDGLSALAGKETVRTQGDPDFHPLACEYARRFEDIRTFWNRYDRNLIAAFAYLHQVNKIELITSSATHAFLPYVLSEGAVRAQIRTAVEEFQRHFGFRPKGMWLPECAYVPRLNAVLEACGIHFFFMDAHGLEHAVPRPPFGTYSPIAVTPSVAAFARDVASSEQVWDRDRGYPGDFDYREYYRDIGFDLAHAYIGPHIHPDGIRVNTGIKYYRITGKNQTKEPYRFEWAENKTKQHAAHFLACRQQQVLDSWATMRRAPILTAPYDAELFGHWWYEGPLFLEHLLRMIHQDQTILQTITPTEYLAMFPEQPEAIPSMSTWGRNGYGEVWLNNTNDWVYPALHQCEMDLVELADAYYTPSPVLKRALNQAARELMLAESSDWAFIMDARTMVDYAVRRTKHHVNRFQTLVGMVRTNSVDEGYLSALEQMDNLFPTIDYRHYRTASVPATGVMPRNGSKPCILMLSWEFPPMMVGGLSRHVYDLSRTLAKQGYEVHVVTTAIGEYPLHEDVMGVHVHRVNVLQPDGGEFIHFVLQLNLMMLDECRRLAESGVEFDIIHAHDWLVCTAALELKRVHRLPLLATIHATEHGRNHGIHSDVQRHIHNLECELVREADRVIVCSSYMKREVSDLFQIREDKIDVLPNGIDEKAFDKQSGKGSTGPSFNQGERTIVFIGRLVQEKGIQVLLSAAPSVVAAFPETRFVIVGRGPMQASLASLAQQLNISDCVRFLGFVSDEERDRLFATATAAVFPSLYEPFGIVALEAMAAGTPVIVSDVGGLADIVQHDVNGLTTLVGDPQSVATQIKRVLADESFANGLADQARRDLVRYSWEQIAQNTGQIYANLAGQPMAGAGSKIICTPVTL